MYSHNVNVVTYEYILVKRPLNSELTRFSNQTETHHWEHALDLEVSGVSSLDDLEQEREFCPRSRDLQ